MASKAQALPGLEVYRFTHGMYYANAEQLSQEITKLASSADPPLPSIFGILREKGIRPVAAQVMEDVWAESCYQLEKLFGEDAFYDSLQDVVEAYRQQAGTAAK